MPEYAIDKQAIIIKVCRYIRIYVHLLNNLAKDKANQLKIQLQWLNLIAPIFRYHLHLTRIQ